MENQSDPIDPFAGTPSSPPTSTNPPSVPSVASAAPNGPRRGRMAIATVATFGLVGTGVVGLTQLSSDDGDDGDAAPAALAAVTDEPTDTSDDTSDDTAEDTSDDTSDDGADDGADDSTADDGTPGIDGEIVIETGDGDPIVIDLGSLDGSTFEEFRECAGLPTVGDLSLPDIGIDLDDADLDELLGEFEGPLAEWIDGLGDIDFPRYDDDFVFGTDGNQITVLGEDGVRVIDLGDGDASVTITQSDGDLEITTDGDVSVNELSDLFGDFDFDLESLPDLGADLDLDRLLDDLDGLPGLDELAEFDLPALGDFPDGETIQNCLDRIG